MSKAKESVHRGGNRCQFNVKIVKMSKLSLGFAIIFVFYTILFQFFFSTCQYTMLTCYVLNPDQSIIYTGEQLYKCHQAKISKFICPHRQLLLFASFSESSCEIVRSWHVIQYHETLSFILNFHEGYSIHITGGDNFTSLFELEKYYSFQGHMGNLKHSGKFMSTHMDLWPDF